MSYMRIIPRDLFNEAKLLKCFGRLALLVHDGMVPKGIKITIEPAEIEGGPFKIEQDPTDGGLFIYSYDVDINGKSVFIKTSLNSKSNYPLLCETAEDTVFVFDEEGNFSKEFIEMWTNTEK